MDGSVLEEYEIFILDPGFFYSLTFPLERFTHWSRIHYIKDDYCVLVVVHSRNLVEFKEDCQRIEAGNN